MDDMHAGPIILYATHASSLIPVLREVHALSNMHEIPCGVVGSILSPPVATAGERCDSDMAARGGARHAATVPRPMVHTVLSNLAGDTLPNARGYHPQYLENAPGVHQSSAVRPLT